MSLFAPKSSSGSLVRTSKVDLAKVTNLSITPTPNGEVGVVLTTLDSKSKIAVSMLPDEAGALFCEWLEARTGAVKSCTAEWATLTMSKGELRKRLSEAHEHPFTLGEALCDLRAMNGGRWACRALGVRWGVAHTTAAGWVREMSRQGLLFDVSAVVKTVN